MWLLMVMIYCVNNRQGEQDSRADMPRCNSYSSMFVVVHLRIIRQSYLYILAKISPRPGSKEYVGRRGYNATG